jgi:hypothetical protein
MEIVMPGLVPGIHVLQMGRAKDVDGRDEPGHDGKIHSAAAPPTVHLRQRPFFGAGAGKRPDTGFIGAKFAG